MVHWDVVGELQVHPSRPTATLNDKIKRLETKLDIPRIKKKKAHGTWMYKIRGDYKRKGGLVGEGGGLLLSQTDSKTKQQQPHGRNETLVLKAHGLPRCSAPSGGRYLWRRAEWAQRVGRAGRAGRAGRSSPSLPRTPGGWPGDPQAAGSVGSAGSWLDGRVSVRSSVVLVRHEVQGK